MDTSQLREDIATAYEAMAYKFMNKKEIRNLHERLRQGERVLRMTSGKVKGADGLVVLTDTRVLVYSDGWSTKAFEALDLAQVRSVDWSSKGSWGRMTVHASGARLEADRMAREEGRQFAETVDNYRAEAAGQSVPQPAPVAAPVEAGPVDPLALLAQLRQLRDTGRLSAEAFGPVAVELSQM